MEDINVKLKKIMLIIFILIIVIIIGALTFIDIWLDFGKTPSEKSKKIYSAKTEYYHDGKYHNSKDFEMLVKVKERNMITEMLTSHPDTKPKGKIPVDKIDEFPHAEADEMKITWFGHSTVMLQMHGMNILTDPVLSRYVSPVSFIGSERMAELPMEAENLPLIDLVLISHDHYDHLDYETIKKIDSKVKKYCVPLGVESRLQRWNIDKEKINSMAWYDELQIEGINVAFTPAQHNSGRGINDSDSTLWGGYYLKDQYHSFYYTGDTGKGDFFKDINERYGSVELMMADTGQYDEMWPYYHMNPQESLQSAEEMKTKWLVPVHWAGFALANHPWYEPGEKITELAEKSDINVATPIIGQTIDFKDIAGATEKWWKELK